MKHLLLIGFLCTWTIPASADEFYELVGYKCDRANDQIVVTYRGAFNERGREMADHKGPNEWDPWSLVGPGKVENRLGELTTIKKSCKLSDGQYVVEIGPAPGNMNYEGECGAFMSAWTAILKDSKVIGRYQFEQDCTDLNPVITKIVVRARSSEPELTRVQAADFYK